MPLQNIKKTYKVAMVVSTPRVRHNNRRPMGGTMCVDDANGGNGSKHGMPCSFWIETVSSAEATRRRRRDATRNGLRDVKTVPVVLFQIPVIMSFTCNPRLVPRAAYQ
ncbi:hypothetical protein AB1N83_007609 [Pleurotus pulmonarius]